MTLDLGLTKPLSTHLAIRLHLHGVGGTWMSGSIIEDVAFILGEVTDVGYDVQC